MVIDLYRIPTIIDTIADDGLYYVIGMIGCVENRLDDTYQKLI